MTPIPPFRRLLQTAILLGLAAYFGRLILTGDLANYVNVRIEWLIALAALLLGVYGTCAWLRPEEHACCGAHEHRGSWKVLALILPLALGFGLPSKPLGARSIDDGDIQAMLRENIDMSMLATAERIDNPAMLYNPMNDLYPERQFSTEDPLQFTILDWLRLYADTDKKDLFEGQKADVIGFVLRDPTRSDGFIVTRFFMRHCMFDTIPIGLAVNFEDADDFHEDTWVRVRGTFKLQTVDGMTAPVLEAESVKRVDQPETPYLYPSLN